MAPINETGTEFGRYRLLQCLGQGGMGAVYLAFDQHLQRHVALKQILGQHRADDHVLARFRREALALSRLDHPHLCRIYDAGEHEGVPFVAMQYVEGEPLAAAITAAADGERPVLGPASPRSGPPRPWLPGRAELDQLLVFFAKAARALHHAHEQGLVHRDVKPGNLMVARNGEPVVLDFGLAADRSGETPALTLTGQGLGTPMYMPPEQVESRPTDARSDVYALAVSLYHAATLVPPFMAPTLQQLFVRIVDEHAPDPRRRNAAIGAELATVLAVAMAKSPLDRYHSAAAFADDLQRLVAREPIVARRQSHALRTWRWCQRNRLLAAFVAVLTTSLLATAAALASASAARDDLQRSLDSFDRLATLEDLKLAEAAANTLWPAWPERADDLRAWIEQHGDPLAAKVAALRREGVPLTAEPRTMPQQPDGRRNSGSIDPATEAYVARTLREQIPALEHFATATAGTRASVARRLAWASGTARDTLAHPGWPAAIATVAADPRLRGLDLVPQIDLVPLGADPVSGLQEFLHLPSHAEGEPVPDRSVEGRLDLGETAGIVFVLLPGGMFTMGAQRDSAQPNHDPDAEPDEAPLHQVSLDPFLLGKHEVTQAQWLRLTGTNPSQFQPSTPVWSARLQDGSELTFRAFTLRHPVEQVSWQHCHEAMRQQGLALPTEAQWEYACRAGTGTVFACDEVDLRHAANLADAFARPFTSGAFCAYHEWSDGFVVTAPVGSFRANAFGLHDMHGNVYEWCADWLVPYADAAPRPNDGLREPKPDGERRNRVYRGGDFRFLAKEARSANRMRGPETEAGNTLGVRAARRLRAPAKER